MTLRRMSRIDYHLGVMSQSAPRGTERPLFISAYSHASDDLRHEGGMCDVVMLVRPQIEILSDTENFLSEKVVE